MSKFDKTIGWYIAGSFPLIIILMIWSYTSDPEALSMSSGIIGTIWDSLGWIFMTWIVLSLYFVVKMVIKKDFRKLVLGKVSGLKERDERESIISGEKAKFSFLSTSALILLMLFLSLFTIKIAKSTDPNIEEGKRGYISIGMNIKPFSSKRIIKEIRDEIEIFTYNGVPLSSTAIILIILLWQFFSYRFYLSSELE